jgi:hypothetical protein
MKNFDLVTQINTFTNDYNSGKVSQDNYHDQDIEYMEYNDVYINDHEFDEIKSQNDNSIE